MVRSSAPARAARARRSTTSSQAVDALVTRRPALGARQRRRGEKSLYLRPFMFASEAFLGVRPAAARDVHGDRQPGRRLLQGRHQAGHALADRGVHPRRPRRHGRGEDRRQLRQLAGRRSRRPPPRAATRSSSSTRQEGKYVEELGGMNMYFVFDDGRIVTPETGTILEGITRASIIELAGKLGHQVEERQVLDRRVARRRRQRRRSPRSSPAAPPRSSPRSATLKWDGGEPRPPASTDLTIRDPPGAGRHPVRPRRRHVRLDAPDRLAGPWGALSGAERAPNHRSQPAPALQSTLGTAGGLRACWRDTDSLLGGTRPMRHALTLDRPPPPGDRRRDRRPSVGSGSRTSGSRRSTSPRRCSSWGGRRHRHPITHEVGTERRGAAARRLGRRR